jgi:hypothetical protein
VPVGTEGFLAASKFSGFSFGGEQISLLNWSPLVTVVSSQIEAPDIVIFYLHFTSMYPSVSVVLGPSLDVYIHFL